MEPIPLESGIVNSDFIKSFHASMEKKEFLFQFYDLFPLPIEIFAPDGTAVYINRALMEFYNITDASTIVGKFNIKEDPICNDLFGWREHIKRGFNGEAVVLPEVPLPVQDLVDRNVIGERRLELDMVRIHTAPVFNDGKLAFIICAFVTTRTPQRNMTIAIAKEYIEAYWKEKFDAEKIARTLKVSRSHLDRVFKIHEGESMYDYYIRVKVERIKENLRDPNLNVKEAFEACGVNPKGSYFHYFKRIVGKTPSEYRKAEKID